MKTKKHEEIKHKGATGVTKKLGYEETNMVISLILESHSGLMVSTFP